LYRSTPHRVQNFSEKNRFSFFHNCDGRCCNTVQLSPQAEAWGYTDRLGSYSLTVHGEGYLNRTVLGGVAIAKYAKYNKFIIVLDQYLFPAIFSINPDSAVFPLLVAKVQYPHVDVRLLHVDVRLPHVDVLALVVVRVQQR
jgi:hypothetical protein